MAERTEGEGEAGASSSSERSLPNGLRLELAAETAGEDVVAEVCLHFASSSSSESRSLPKGLVDVSFSFSTHFCSLVSLTTIARLA